MVGMKVQITKYIDDDSQVIACEITKSWQGADGREIVSIDTASPWAVEAVTGETDFDVLREQIIEFQ